MAEYEIRKNDTPILFYHPEKKSVMYNEECSLKEIRKVLMECLKYINDWTNRDNGYERYRAIIDVGHGPVVDSDY